LRHFWAKTGAAVDGRPDWHPCLFHALDVAAVGQAMLERQPVLLERICGTLGLPEDAVRALVLQWLLLHDVGKLSRPFQAMSRPHWPAALGPWPVDLPAEPRHAPMATS